MRNLGIATLVLLVLVLPALVIGADGTYNGDFVRWAMGESQRLDSRWEAISSQSGGDFAQPDGTCVTNTTFAPQRVKSSSSKLRSSIIVGRDFIHKGRNLPFLPLSTRERNSASRGTGALRNPSKARLPIAYKRLRPVKSFMTEKRFFGARKSFVRPKLHTNRRISLSRYRSGRNATRPSYRPSRPKRFKSLF